MGAYNKIHKVLKEMYETQDIIKIIESVEIKYKSTTSRQRRRNQEIKKDLLVDYIQSIFSKSVCDSILLTNKEGKYTIKLKTLSSSIEKVYSYEATTEDNIKICKNYNKTDLYIVTMLEGVEDNDKFLPEEVRTFKSIKSYIDNTLCKLEKWKNDTKELISSFPYWNDLREDIKQKHIVNDIRLLYSIFKDKKQSHEALIASESDRINKKRDLEVEFPLKSEGKERIGVIYSDKATSIKNYKEKSELQQLLNSNLMSKEIALNDNTSIYYMTDNDEQYSRTYYFLMNKEDGEEDQITGLTMIDIDTLSSLLKLAADDLITDRALIYSFRDIACNVYGTTRLSMKEYRAVYNSLIKLSSFVGKVKSNKDFSTNIYDLIKCKFFYPKSTEDRNDNTYDKENIKTFQKLKKDDSFALLQVNVRFSSEYVDRLKRSVFLDKELSDKISNNRLAKAISILLQTERYEWYKQCLENKIDKEKEVRLNHKNFFCRQLYLPIKGSKMYRDRDNILEVMKMISETQLIIQGEVQFDKKTWEYCFHFVDFSTEEVNEIHDAVSNLRSKVLIPFLPIEEK